MIVKKCIICNKDFLTWPYRVRNNVRFCSKKCMYVSAKGRIGYWKGKKFSKKHRENISLSIKNDEKRRGQYHGNWKGDAASYVAIHMWISKWLGKPKYCEYCKTTTAKRFDWANKSGEYKRELSDWIRLCKKCHIKYDDIINRGWVTRKIRRIYADTST